MSTKLETKILFLDKNKENTIINELEKALENPLPFGSFNLEVVFYDSKVRRFVTSTIKSHING